MVAGIDPAATQDMFDSRDEEAEEFNFWPTAEKDELAMDAVCDLAIKNEMTMTEAMALVFDPVTFPNDIPF